MSETITEMILPGTYIDVRAIVNLTPSVASTTQDDSSYDDIGDDGTSWGSDTVTQLKWQISGTCDRKTAAGYVEDPGQAILRIAAAEQGSAAVVPVRWYDRFGGVEAYTGNGIVTWTEKGGSTADKSSVDFTVMGRGPRVTISNPAA